MSEAASAVELARQVNVGKALDLRIGGANYRQIAKALGISLGSAYLYVTEALDQLRQTNGETVELLRQLEVSRLDAMLVSLWSKRDQPRAADTILRLCERRSRLLGLDVGRFEEEMPPRPPNSFPATIAIVLVAPPDRARRAAPPPVPM